MKALLLSLVISISCLGQSTSKPQCVMTTANAPIVRGLRLGQDLQTAQRAIDIEFFPSGESRGSESQTFRVFPKISGNANGNLQGIDSLVLVFFRDRLYEIGIEYDTSTKWPSRRDFYTQLSSGLNLPDIWVMDERQYSATLDCGDVIFSASLMGKPSLTIIDINTQRARKSHEQAIEQMKRKTFRP